MAEHPQVSCRTACECMLPQLRQLAILHDQVRRTAAVSGRLDPAEEM